MQLLRKHSSTSNIIRFRARSSSTGQGFTGLLFSATGLIVSTICDNEAAPTVYTAAGSTTETITTLGTYSAPTATKCRLKLIDDTNDPGDIELQLADARFSVAGAKELRIFVSGVSGMLGKEVLIQLDPAPADVTHFGGTAGTFSGGKPSVKLTAADAPQLLGYTTVVFVPWATNATTSGTALKAALDAATARTLVVADAGTFTVGASVQLLLADGVSLRGAGKDVTSITGGASLGMTAALIKPGVGSVVEDLHIDQSALRGVEDGTASIPYGKATGDAAFSGAVLRRVRITSYSDCVYLVSPGTAWNGLLIEDCDLETNIDGVLGTTADNFYVRLDRCRITLKELNPEESSRNLVFCGWVDLFDCDLRDLGTEAGATVKLVTGNKIRVMGGNCYSVNAGTVYHLYAGTTYFIVGGVSYDASKTSGTITVIPTHGADLHQWRGSTPNALVSGRVDGLGVLATGTVASTTGTTTTLDTGATATASLYLGSRLVITSGTGAGQERIITAYTSGRVATHDAWTTNPNGSSGHAITEARAGTASGGSSPTVAEIAAALAGQVGLTVYAPVTYQHLDIYRADTYTSAQGSGRKLPFTKAASETHWPDTILTVHLTIQPTAAAVANGVATALQKLDDVAGVVTSNSIVYVELLGTQTDDLAAGVNAYNWWLIANAATAPATLRSGTCTVRPDPA